MWEHLHVTKHQIYKYCPRLNRLKDASCRTVWHQIMSALMMAAWLFSAAEIFMTGSQPLSFTVSMQPGLSEHLSEALLQKLCRWHQRKRKVIHTPAACAWHEWCEENVQGKIRVFSFWWGVLFRTLRLFTRGNKILHNDTIINWRLKKGIVQVFSGLICWD